MKKNLVQTKKNENEKVVRVFKDKTRYRVIKFDNNFIIFDCKRGFMWGPFTRAWTAEDFIHKVLESKTPCVHTAVMESFEKHPDFRALAEAKTEYSGKFHPAPRTDSNFLQKAIAGRRL